MPEMAEMASLRSSSGGSSRSYVAQSDTLQYDGINHASTQESYTGTILRKLQEEIGEVPFAQWGLGVLDSFQQAQILQLEVLRQCDGSEAKETDSRLFIESCESPRNMPDWTLLALREAERIGRSSPRQELAEQFAREFGAHLSKLPSESAQQAATLQGLWEASEGSGVLYQALSAIQEVGRSTGDKGQSVHATQDGGYSEPREILYRSWMQFEIERQESLRQALHATEASRHTSVRSQGSVMAVRRLTPL